MKIRSLATTLLAIQAVEAQTLFTDLIVTDVDQGPGACIRMPLYIAGATSPVTDLSSDDMACGYNGTYGVWRVCPVEQGGSLTFQFKEYPDNSHPGVLASGIKGPCSVYMKYVQTAVGDPGVGNGWFKIYEQGYDKNNSQWCTDWLVQYNGLLSVVMPTELAGGYYLVHPELITLKQGSTTPSFYTGCAQVYLDSTETTLPKDVVSIPGHIQAGDPSLQFNISAPSLPYTVPGPKVYVSNVSPTVQQANLPLLGEGLLPPNVVLTNGNWFGIELASYSTAEGCKNATASCYNQSTACYSAAGPIGTANCNIWTNKCENMTSNCNSGNYNGSPDKGKNLNPVACYVLPANTHAATGQPGSSATTSASVTSHAAPTLISITTTIFSSTSKPTLSISTSPSLLTATDSTSLVTTSSSKLGNVTPTSFSRTPALSASSSSSVLLTSLSIPSTFTSSSTLSFTSSLSSVSVSKLSTVAPISVSSTSSSIVSIIASGSASSTTVSTLSTTSSTVPPSSSSTVEATASSPSSSHSTFVPTSSISIPIATDSTIDSSTLSSPLITFISTTVPILSLPTLSTFISTSVPIPSLSTLSSSSTIPTTINTESPLGATSSSPRSVTTPGTSSAMLTASLPNTAVAPLSSVLPTIASATPTIPPNSVISSTFEASPTTSTAQMSTVVEVTTVDLGSSSSTSTSYIPDSPSSPPSTYYSTPNPGAKVSPNGRCGPETGYTCLGNQSGQCCSSEGYCGATESYCAKMYCQPLWGQCDSAISRVKLIRHRHRHLGRDYWSKRD